MEEYVRLKRETAKRMIKHIGRVSGGLTVALEAGKTMGMPSELVDTLGILRDEVCDISVTLIEQTREEPLA